jgi:hypothetical protein
MSDLKLKSPVALAGADRAAMSKKHLSLIIQNDNRRQLWRARVPMHPIAVSDELRAFLCAMNGER